jgi:hypothetical protein
MFKIERRDGRCPVAVIPGNPAEHLDLFVRIACRPHVGALLDAKIGHDCRRFPQYTLAIDKSWHLLVGIERDISPEW